MPYDIFSGTENLFSCLDAYPWNLEVNEWKRGYMVKLRSLYPIDPSYRVRAEHATESEKPWS